MNILADINYELAGLLPARAWAAIQILLGAIVIVGLFVQRVYGEKFQKRTAMRPLDALFVRVSQTGLATIGIMAFVVVLDGMLSPTPTPRAFIILGLFAYSLIQARTVYQAIAAAWLPRHHPVPPEA